MSLTEPGSKDRLEQDGKASSAVISGVFLALASEFFEETGRFFDGKVGEDSSAVTAGVFLLTFASKVFEATRRFFEIKMTKKLCVRSQLRSCEMFNKNCDMTNKMCDMINNDSLEEEQEAK